MSYLQCPECRLTVPATTYYLRGDECPRCRTAMEPRKGLARTGPPPALVERDSMVRGTLDDDGSRRLNA